MLSEKECGTAVKRENIIQNVFCKVQCITLVESILKNMSKNNYSERLMRMYRKCEIYNIESKSIA